jgi:hypothetical protein
MFICGKKYGHEGLDVKEEEIMPFKWYGHVHLTECR